MHLSATVRLPRDPGGVTHWEFADPPVLVGVTTAERVGELDGTIWSAPGVYCLLGPADDRDAGALRAEVGGAQTRLRTRVLDQRRSREWWDSVVTAVCGAWLASARWGPSEATYLEGQLYRRLRGELFGELANRVSPPRVHLDGFRVADLDRSVGAIASVLYLLGSVHIAAVGSAPPPGDRPAQTTWVRAAAQALDDVGGEGLPVRDICARIHAAGLRDPRDSLTPEQTLHRELRHAARNPRVTGIARIEGTPVRYALTANTAAGRLTRRGPSR